MPLMEFTGTNGEEIAAARSAAVFPSPPEGDQSKIIMDPAYPGPSLNLLWVYPSGEMMPNAYRVPIGFSLDTDTGEIFNNVGELQEMATLLTID